MSKHILLIDDEVGILNAYKRLIQRPGVNVDTAESFDETMSLLNDQHYDIVIADLRLTGVQENEGLKILQYVKQQKPETGVIILTGYGSVEVMKKAFSLGANYYFEKPIPYTILSEALKAMGVS
jgi:DNA-binding NtrC family response regulator